MDGVSAGSTPISVTGGSITNFGRNGISASSHNLTVSGVTITNPVPNAAPLKTGILASGLSNRIVLITNNTISGAGSAGISLSNPSNVAPGSFALTGNIITSSGLAIRIASMTASLGAGGNIDGNHGQSNALDTIAFDGSAMNLLRWVSARAIKETFVPPRTWRYPFMG